MDFPVEMYELVVLISCECKESGFQKALNPERSSNRKNIKFISENINNEYDFKVTTNNVSTLMEYAFHKGCYTAIKVLKEKFPQAVINTDFINETTQICKTKCPEMLAYFSRTDEIKIFAGMNEQWMSMSFVDIILANRNPEMLMREKQGFDKLLEFPFRYPREVLKLLKIAKKNPLKAQTISRINLGYGPADSARAFGLLRLLSSQHFCIKIN